MSGLVIVVFALLMVGALILANSRRGSGISAHPTDGRGQAHGAERANADDHDHDAADEIISGEGKH